jgi:hypothetical protein
MESTFKEKSLMLMFATTALAFGYYFIAILPQASVDLGVENIALFLAVLIIMVIIQIAGHIIIAVVDRPDEESDERDRLIALKSVRNGAYLLGTGVIASIGCALTTDGNFIFVHVLFAFLVMAQLLEYGSQLYFYRRGA